MPATHAQKVHVAWGTGQKDEAVGFILQYMSFWG